MSRPQRNDDDYPKPDRKSVRSLTRGLDLTAEFVPAHIHALVPTATGMVFITLSKVVAAHFAGVLNAARKPLWHLGIFLRSWLARAWRRQRFAGPADMLIAYGMGTEASEERQSICPPG